MTSAKVAEQNQSRDNRLLTCHESYIFICFRIIIHYLDGIWLGKVFENFVLKFHEGTLSQAADMKNTQNLIISYQTLSKKCNTQG